MWLIWWRVKRNIFAKGLDGLTNLPVVLFCRSCVSIALAREAIIAVRRMGKATWRAPFKDMCG